MPELPDVVIFKRYFDSTALHQLVEQVTVLDDALLEDVSARTLKQRLEGTAFEQTKRHGKHLFAQFDEEAWLALHFGMTGNLKYYRNPEESPEYTRLRIDFENGYHLAYISVRKLGRISLAERPEAFIEARELGPDALELDEEAFRQRLEGRKGSIKSTLMNQQILAGIGNIYSDEILFQMGLHPRTGVDTLEDDTVRKLYRTLQRVLHVAIDHQADPADFPSSYLLPHREVDEECPRCGGRIERVDVSGRSAYYCPSCQSEP